MKILVFGAGVLGSLYAARMKEAGQDVTILARGARLSSIQKNGIVLQHAFTKKIHTTRIRVVGQLQPEDKYDWIIVFVRQNQVPNVLPILTAHTSTPNILMMVNNPSGYQTWIDAIGKNRLVVGFAGAGGTCENEIISYALAPGFFQPTTVAELDGQPSVRVALLVRLFKQAGFPTTISRNMDAWQKTHIAWVSPIANAIYKAEEEGVDLSNARHIIAQTVNAIRENYAILGYHKIPITPSKLNFWNTIPAPILEFILRLWMKTPHFKILIYRHSMAAKDEMSQIADEFSTLAAAANLSSPARDFLQIKNNIR